MAKSEDALDQYRGRQKFGKAEKRAYAKKMFEEDLVRPPKNPIKPQYLPKRPPGARAEEPIQAAPPSTAPAPRPKPAHSSERTEAFLKNPLYAPWHHLIRRILEIP